MGLVLPPGGQVARASVMAADAADYVPTVASLPPGFREESSDAVGGDLEPTIAMRRSFLSQDGLRRVVVDVSLGSSIGNAQGMIDARVNQLVQYQGWQINKSSGFGDIGYRGTGPAPDGASAAMILFRNLAVTAEITTSTAGGSADVTLLDNVARLVARRIDNEPDALAYQPGWPIEPVSVPGKEPINPGLVAIGPGGVVPPGAEVTGSSSGSATPGDTIVIMTVTGLDRPWSYGGSAPRPPVGMEYLTAEVEIDVHGQTEVTLATTDFWLSTFDGRSWSPVLGRSPAVPTGSVVFGVPSRGWLTFLIPVDQPALQVTWRIRTTESLSSQGNVDQTIVIPLTVGATASASVGTSAPPAGAPVVPPSSAPSGPGGPAGPSGPSAPTPTPSSDGSGGSGTGGGGGGRPRRGTGLQ
jgi:hypothetical protein